MRYYLDKCFIQGGVCCSCESGAFDKMYFDTIEEAERYAWLNDYRLEDDEVFLIEEVDE